MRQLIGYAVSGVILAAVAFAFAPRNPAALVATQLQVDRVQVNALLVNGQQLLAAGERGTLLSSLDSGRSWQSAQVSAEREATLTGLIALNSQTLVAVGHDGWILRSDDSGRSWQETRYDADLGEPLLGVWSGDGEQVVAYGSYGKYLESRDAG
ncbi:MAG: glycosyl hydrolase, partial [Pseudomonas sp.]